MNILVTALSLSKPSSDTPYILSKEGRDYHVTAQRTNEPVPKALQLYLQRKGETLDKMIALCTPATLVADESGKSCLDIFCDAFSHSENSPEIQGVALQEMTDSQSVYNTCLQLLNICGKTPNPQIYIDFTGGFRDNMMFLISMMQLLKEENFHIADIFYTVYDRSANGPHSIVSRMDAYRVYDLISGYEDLKVYGDPKKLKEYFSLRHLSDDANKILIELEKIYQEMKLCRVEQSNKALIRISTLLENYSPDGSEFDRVVDLARTKYGGIQEKFTPQDYIRWYFHHGFVPQTLAFLYETLPGMLVSNKVIYPSQELYAMLLEEIAKNINLQHHTPEFRFITAYCRTFNKEIAEAKAEIERIEKGMDIPVEQLFLSDVGKKIREGLYALKLGRLDARYSQKEEVVFLIKALENAFPGEDLCKIPSEKICRKIMNHQRIICNLYGIDLPNMETETDFAKAVMAAVDNENVFLGENVNVEALENLLEEFFFLKNQRNSIFHVGTSSASYKTLQKHIRKAIELIDEVM